MTSKLKCPYCSADLESTTGGWEYGCSNAECLSAGTLCGTEELWQALIKTRQDLEQSEKCCSAWETQALDYKAETIALSGKLEIAKQALEKYADEDMWETGHRWEVDYIQALFLEQGYKIAKEALEQINRKED